jgi:hypothetical protein
MRRIVEMWQAKAGAEFNRFRFFCPMFGRLS